MSLAIGALASTAVGYVIEGIKNSKIVEKVSETAATKFWEWIKPKVEGEDVIEDLKANPEDEDLKIELQSKIKRMLKKDPEFAKELEEMLEKSGGKEGLSKINTVNVTGDGNVTIQDFQGNISGNIGSTQSKKLKVERQVNFKEGGTYNENK